MRTETDDDGRIITYDDDGRCLSVRVPSLVMDHERRDNVIPALHRPGSLPLTDAERQARLDPYLERRQALSDAWRTPRPVPTQDDGTNLSHPPAPSTAQQAHDERTKRLADAWKHPRQTTPAGLPARRKQG